MDAETGDFEVLLACTVCGTQRTGDFTMPELLDLVEVQSQILACERCQVSTSWSVLAEDRRSGSRRASRRVPVKMPIYVEGMGLSEVTHTVNISKGNLRFFSKRNYGEGMELLVRVPYDPEVELTPVSAKVIWVSPVEQGFHIGIILLP